MSFYPSSPLPLPMTLPYATTLAGVKMDPSSLSWNHWLFLTLTFYFIYKGFLKRHPVSCLPFCPPVPVPSWPLVYMSRGKGKGRKRKGNTETDSPPPTHSSTTSQQSATPPNSSPSFLRSDGFGRARILCWRVMRRYTPCFPASCSLPFVAPILCSPPSLQLTHQVQL